MSASVNPRLNRLTGIDRNIAGPPSPSPNRLVYPPLVTGNSPLGLQ